MIVITYNELMLGEETEYGILEEIKETACYVKYYFSTNVVKQVKKTNLNERTIEVSRIDQDSLDLEASELELTERFEESKSMKVAEKYPTLYKIARSANTKPEILMELGAIYPITVLNNVKINHLFDKDLFELPPSFLVSLLRSNQCPEDIVKECLSNKDFKYYDICLQTIAMYKNIEKIDLTLAYLEYIDFKESNFKGAIFTEAEIRNHVRFISSNLSHTFFCDSLIEKTRFEDCDFNSASFNGCTINLSEFINCNFENAKFTKCTIIETDLSNSNLSSAFFNTCNIIDVKHIDDIPQVDCVYTSNIDSE